MRTRFVVLPSQGRVATVFRRASASLGMLLLLGSVIAPGVSPAHASHPRAAQHVVRPSRPSARDEGTWFQLAHFGRQVPSPEARLKALAQAKELPLASGSSVLSPLGPEPLNSNAGWGPVSGRVTAVAVNPTNASEVWIGTGDGGVWHSTDGGQDWTPMTDTQPTLSVGAIAVSPTSPSTIYVGTGEANLNGDAYPGMGVLESTNDGATWVQHGLNYFGGLGIARIAIDPANSSIILLAASYNGPSTVPGGPSNLYNNTGIWRSANGGINWSQVLSDPNQPGPDAGTDVVFDPANPSIVFAGLGNLFATNPTTASGVYRSTDSGKTWTQLTNGLPNGSDVERVSLAISQDGSHVYAVITDGDYRDAPNKPHYGDLLGNAIYVSTDGGNTWTAQNVASVPGMVDDDGTQQWWYDSYAAVDPSVASGTTAYVGGADIWQTTDGGNTWTNLTNAYNGGPVHPAQHALAFLSSVSSSYYLGNDGGVWSGTGGGTFTNLNGGGLNITEFYSGSIGDTGPDAALYGGAQGNGADQYPAGANGIAQWNQVYGGDGGDIVVDYTNNAIVYEEAAYGAINKSTDGGQTWAPAANGIDPSDPVNFVMPLIMSPGNNNELFAGTDRIYRTTDGANSWTAISSSLDNGTPVSAIAVAPLNDAFIYAGDNAGNLFVTTDGGSTWSSRHIAGSTGGMVTSLAVDPANPSTVYAAFANYASGPGEHLFRSTDAGTTWTDISTALPNAPVESVLVNPAGGSIIVGTDVGLFISMNNGSTWSRFGTGFPNVAVDQIFTNHSGTEIYVATHGRGMWSIPNPLSVYVGSYSSSVYALQASSGIQRWRYQTQNMVRSSPTLAGGVLYIGSADDNVYAIDTLTGSLIWRYQTAGPILASPTVASGVVYVSSYYPDDAVYALQANNGTLLWRYQTGAPVLSTPAVANGVVYVGSRDNSLYALNASTGALLWSYQTGSPVDSSPVVSNGIVYVGSNDGSIYALDASAGMLIWRYQTGNFVESTPAVVNGVVYVGSDDHTVYALNASTGALLWSYQTGGPVDASPAVANGVVYIGSTDDNVYALNASNGALLWRYQTGNYVESTPAVVNGVVYVGSDDNFIYALNAGNGALIWSFQTPNFVRSSPTVGP
jgi:outer membrane protein assembly factor BamB